MPSCGIVANDDSKKVLIFGGQGVNLFSFSLEDPMEDNQIKISQIKGQFKEKPGFGDGQDI
jgi:hypothetical protein